MKKSIKAISLSLMAIIIISSCKKDKDDPAPAASPIGRWMQVAGVYSPAYFGETDFFSSSPSCEKDDIFELKANNTFELNEGATKCDPSDPQILLTGPYTINSAGTTITLFSEQSNMELNGNTLKISHPFSDGGVNYLEIRTFQRQ